MAFVGDHHKNPRTVPDHSRKCPKGGSEKYASELIGRPSKDQNAQSLQLRKPNNWGNVYNICQTKAKAQTDKLE
jgi:hypothetical protein